MFIQCCDTVGFVRLTLCELCVRKRANAKVGAALWRLGQSLNRVAGVKSNSASGENGRYFSPMPGCGLLQACCRQRPQLRRSTHRV